MKVFGTDYDEMIINIEPQKAAAFGLLVSRRWGVDVDKTRDFWSNSPDRISTSYSFNHSAEGLIAAGAPPPRALSEETITIRQF